MQGFTRPEQRAILFLLSTFGLGTVIWWHRQCQPLPAANPAAIAALDEFAKALHGDSAHASAPANEPAQAASALPQPVDLNAATYSELVRLPGIGPVMAKRIIEYRDANGAFKRLPDLRKVKGIGAKTYQKLAPLLMIEPDQKYRPATK